MACHRLGLIAGLAVIVCLLTACDGQTTFSSEETDADATPTTGQLDGDSPDSGSTDGSASPDGSDRSPAGSEETGEATGSATGTGPTSTDGGRSTEDTGAVVSGDEVDAAESGRVVQVYYLREQEDQTWIEPEPHQLSPDTVGVAQAAVKASFERSPRDPALSLVGEGPVGEMTASVDGSTLVLDFAENPLAGEADLPRAEALAATATQFDSFDALQISVDGEPVTEALTPPTAPDSFVVSPIVISEPRFGEQVSGTLEASGTSNTFEATLQLLLTNPQGETAAQATVTATCGTGCRGDWSHAFSDVELTSGVWTLVAESPDPSGPEEGPGPFTTQTEFEVP